MLAMRASPRTAYRSPMPSTPTWSATSERDWARRPGACRRCTPRRAPRASRAPA
jgi:hypothetical protein